jgi:hypothetical protein
VFSMIALRATDLEHGVRASPAWILMLLFLIYIVPMTIYLTVLFPSRNELRRAWTSLTASPTVEAVITPFRSAIEALHLHRHPKPLKHAR